MTLKHRLNVLPIIADCILYFESDENRSSHREELNLLFRLNFYTMQFSMFAFRIARNFFSITHFQALVNNFLKFFKSFSISFYRRRFRQLLYITKPSNLCQPLFSSFSRFCVDVLQFSGAVQHSFINIPNLSHFVNRVFVHFLMFFIFV